MQGSAQVDTGLNIAEPSFMVGCAALIWGAPEVPGCSQTLKFAVLLLPLGKTQYMTPPSCTRIGLVKTPLSLQGRWPSVGGRKTQVLWGMCMMKRPFMLTAGKKARPLASKLMSAFPSHSPLSEKRMQPALMSMARPMMSPTHQSLDHAACSALPCHFLCRRPSAAQPLSSSPTPVPSTGPSLKSSVSQPSCMQWSVGKCPSLTS
mmetsp:Transcript_38847/g.120590  ORF Transcript_38847/g.120590 Transcript_38847/m.120590 type:complete len:205 (-) Transcript_38847:286-900(-)